MKPVVKTIFKTGIALLVVAILALAWLLYFENKSVATFLPKWGWLQSWVERRGQKVQAAAEEDEDPDTSLNHIPVRVAKITTATLHRYIDGFGVITPRPMKSDEMASSANIAAPAAGVVMKVAVQVGQKVKVKDLLFQMDDRAAKAAEDQAQAALTQAEASLAALKATPRPDQVQIAQLAIEKTQGALDFAKKNYDRQKSLAADESTSQKSVEQAGLDVASAENDLRVAQKQMAILKATPTPEDLAAENAKVAQANAALAAARVQRQLLTVAAPIDGTVVTLGANAGESVDPTKTIVQLVAMDKLMVDVDVPAEQLPETAEGLRADLFPSSEVSRKEGSSDASAAVSGTLVFVSPQVDPKNGTVMVGISLPEGTTYRPGLTVRVRIIAEEHKDVLAVPRAGLLANENGDNVIVLVETAKDAKTGEEYPQATHKSVKAGIEENGMVEVNGPDLKEGMTVVTEGAFGLQALQATRVKIVE